MRYGSISPQLFVNNRKRFTEKLKPGSIAVFHSNYPMPTNADGTMGFKQNSDFFYLTGIDQEDSVLVLFPDHFTNENKEILFVKETNEHIRIWEGEKLTKDAASEISGIKNVRWEKDFTQVFKNLAIDAETIYLNTNEHLRSDTLVKDKDWDFIQYCQNHFPLHSYQRSAPILRRLRTVKNEYELELIRKAIDITAHSFKHIMQYFKPGVFEFEIEAHLVHQYMLQRSRGTAFSTIVASGADSCVLHYISNNKALEKGSHVLLDFGAEFANYNADITRVLPVGGPFSPRVRAVYEAVLRVLNQATNAMVPGNTFENLMKSTGEWITEELLTLGVLTSDEVKNQAKNAPAYKKYFMHGVSHFLGLDVHDVGDRHLVFEEGMVLTCEPGIYIPTEGLGIRLENDILISAQGPVNLSSHIPIEINEIEALVMR